MEIKNLLLVVLFLGVSLILLCFFICILRIIQHFIRKKKDKEEGKVGCVTLVGELIFLLVLIYLVCIMLLWLITQMRIR